MVAASSKNVSFSRLKDSNIQPRLRSIVRAVMKKMLRNHQEYGIRGTDQFQYVKEIVFTNTLVALKQCEGGGIRKMITSVRNENVSYNDKEESKASWRDGLFRS